jgi:Ca2+-binding EF-hand superfamily protein
MSKQFHEHKLKHFFHMLDVNRDGSVTREDYEEIANRVAVLGDIAISSELHTRMVESFRSIWTTISEIAGIEANGRITLDRFIPAYTKWLSNRDAVVPVLAKVMQATMGFLSKGEGDWTINRREWLVNRLAWNMNYVDSMAAFDKLDRNRDGLLQRSEMLKNLEEFLFSEDPEAVGNWFFGPLGAAPK